MENNNIKIGEKIFNFLVAAEESADATAMIRALGFDIEGKTMRGFNAAASPLTGKIYLGRECYEKLSRKEQMAVLAHEIGHLRAEGGMPKLELKYGIMGFAGVVMMESTSAVTIAAIEKFGLLRGGSSLIDSVKYDWKNNRRNLLIVMGIFSGLFFGGLSLTVFAGMKNKAMNHAAEFVADEFAKSLGFGPELASALKKLVEGNGMKLTHKDSVTHPATVERIIRLTMTALAA